jgi:dephospho-CoA kinase
MGAGKSTALSALERMGAAVLSTDAIVHELYASEPVRAAVVGRWGESVAPAGVVDRDAIAARAFGEEGERKWLEGVLWPLVGQRIGEWVLQARARHPSPPAAVVEVPLLFEAGMAPAFDATVAIVADEALRKERAEVRGHALSQERDMRQLPQEEKAHLATFAIHNNGTVEDLERALLGILERLPK